MNGAFPNRALLIAPNSDDFMPNVNVNVNGIAGISRNFARHFGIDPHNWTDDRMQQWTFTIEHELMKNTSLRLSYIGTTAATWSSDWLGIAAESQMNYQTRTGLAIAARRNWHGLASPNPNWNGTSNPTSAIPIRIRCRRKSSGGSQRLGIPVFLHIQPHHDHQR